MKAIKLILLAALVIQASAVAFANEDQTNFKWKAKRLVFVTPNGLTFPKTDKEYIKFCQLAAAQKNAIAQYNLGVAYSKGAGVSQNYQKAVKWYRLAAQQGYPNAQNNLGVAYSRGSGVSQNYREAVKWYRLAAQQGYSNAQNNLGVMYLNNRGVSQDYVEAHKWFNLATANGFKSGSNNRDRVEKLMTSSQIQEAQSLAFEWEWNPSSDQVAQRDTAEQRVFGQKSKTKLGSDQKIFDFKKLAKKVSQAIVLVEGGVTSSSHRKDLTDKRKPWLGPRGTGFIVSPDGRIVTNYHVIEHMRNGGVQLASGKRHDSYSVLAVDKKNDLAIIKISASGLSVIEMQNSKDIFQGESIMVIGTPQGFPSFVTTGIINFIEETDVYRIDGKFWSTIKLITTWTDESIPPGSSGGPLVNFNGKAVGVMTYSSGKLGRSVSINHVQQLLETIKRIALQKSLGQTNQKPR